MYVFVCDAWRRLRNAHAQNGHSKWHYISIWLLARRPIPWGRLGMVYLPALDLRLYGHEFDSRSPQAVQTRVPPLPSSINWNRPKAVTPYGWEGNRRSGVALSQTVGFIHLRAQQPIKGETSSLPTLLGSMAHLCLLPIPSGLLYIWQTSSWEESWTLGAALQSVWPLYALLLVSTLYQLRSAGGHGVRKKRQQATATAAPAARGRVKQPVPLHFVNTHITSSSATAEGPRDMLR